MDWMGLWLVLLGLALAVMVGVFAYAAVMRFRGRRTRFDGLIDTLIRAQSASVFPPSLRADSNPPAIESEEVSRGARAGRDAPNAANPE
jgi:hypothetical protein